MTTLVFATFNCDKDFGLENTSFLVVDYAQRCEGVSYRSLRAYAILCIVIYPIGINLLYAALLMHYRTKIRKGAGAEHVGFLFATYKPEYFYWEIIDNARRYETRIYPSHTRSHPHCAGCRSRGSSRCSLCAVASSGRLSLRCSFTCFNEWRSLLPATTITSHKRSPT